MQSACYKFGDYELDCSRFELRRSGRVLRLERIPMELLILLAERDGNVVTRQEISERLWGKDVFVDTEHGVNTAVRKIRAALQDDPAEPRFVQTVVGKGYRFAAQISAPAPASPEKTKPKLAAWRKPAAAVLALVGGFGLIALALAPRLRPHQQSANLVVVPFTALPGREMSPTFSPDGSQIAFAWSGDPAGGPRGLDIYVKVIGSENLLRLTNHPSAGLRAAWSPDGREIAFHRVSENDTGLYVVPALGGPERRLRATHATSGTSVPISWSPDGKWIAYTDSPSLGGHFRLNLLSMETLASQTIPHAAECEEEVIPAFSHDGRQLAYVCLPPSGGFAVYTVNPRNGEPRKLAQLSGWPWGLAWDGADRRLILGRYQVGTGDDLDALLPDGSLQKLTVGENGKWPALTEKGDKLAYELWEPTKVSIWRRDLLHPAAPPVKLISSTRAELNPQYSPDGKHIALASSRSGTQEIWMSDAGGANLIQLSKLGNPATGSPSWSPDGRKIAFDSGRFGDASVYIVDIDERIPRQLTTTVENASVPSWSHDGKWIYFVGNGNEAGGIIYRCPSQGGPAEPLTSSRGYGPIEAADAGRLYLSRSFAGNTEVQTVPIHGRPGSETDLPEFPPARFGTDWAIAAGGVYFIPATSQKSIHYYDFASRKSTTVFQTGQEFAMGLSVSPDGRWLLYTQTTERSSDIMLVEHFH